MIRRRVVGTLEAWLHTLAVRADSGRKRYAFAWYLALAILVAGAAVRVGVGGGAIFSSNLLNLLPGMRQDPLLTQATDRNRDTFLSSLLIAVAGDNADATAAAAGAVRARLVKAGYKVEDTGKSGDALLDLYRSHRFSLLTPTDAAALATRPDETFITQLEAGLASPASPAGSPADPGGFLTRFLLTLPRPFPDLVPENGLLAAPAAPRPTYLLPVTLAAEAFGESGESRAEEAVRLARTSVATRCPHCTVTASAAALYSAAERREAKQEINWLSTGSLVIIVLLVLGFFRSLRPLVLAVVCIASGLAAGGAVTLLVFGVINLLTLVFGTTLLGIAVDYAFYFLTDRRLNGRGGTLTRIASGLTLAMLMSVTAYAFLAAAPFPALRQMAVFLIAGLVGAYLTVFTLFPLAAWQGTGKVPAALRRRAPGVSGGGRRWRLIATAVLVLAAAGGLARLHANDNLSELQATPPDLVAATLHVNTLLGTPPESGFFFVRGPTLDAALDRERALAANARKQAPELNLLGLAGFVPSPAAQAQARAAWAKLLGDGGDTLRTALTAQGLPAALVSPLIKAWKTNKDTALDAAELLHAVPALGDFALVGHDETGLTVQAYGNASNATLAALAAATPGVQYVYPLGQLDAAFTHIRRVATLWVIIGYLMIMILLMLRHGFGGIMVAMPAIAAALVTLGLLGWLGQPVNVFVVVALILVAGIGGDYAVFLREGKGYLSATAPAVTLAAATTLASFGLLAASRIPALHAFGLTVASGIIVAWIAAPLALIGVRRPA